ncbi:MAG: hypothetical protein ABIA21_04015 [Candidatus Aenigmatarchaeota archaeon]
MDIISRNASLGMEDQEILQGKNLVGFCSNSDYQSKLRVPGLMDQQDILKELCSLNVFEIEDEIFRTILASYGDQNAFQRNLISFICD